MLKDPGDRQPAPGPLRVVQAFVNTVDFENGIEELDSPAALGELLAGLGLLDGDERLERADLERALPVREALRRLLLDNNGFPVEQDALEALEEQARRARLTLSFAGDGTPTLEPQARGVDGALGRILAVVHTAIADGSWQRLKACRRDICHWVFYDASKNRSSTWCAMSVCGNRTKTKEYRRRAGRTREAK